MSVGHFLPILQTDTPIFIITTHVYFVGQLCVWKFRMSQSFTKDIIEGNL